jgi:hypothetical protein
MSASTEDIAASLVREFLSRKGLKRTLAKMDEELPRTPKSISNRTTLARAIHIERQMKKNKERSNPLETMIEVIVKYLVEKSTTAPAVPSTHSSSKPPDHLTFQGATSHTDVDTASGGRGDLSGKHRSTGGQSFGETPPIRVEITPRKAPSVSPTVTHSERPRSMSVREPGLKPVTPAGPSRPITRRERGFRPRSMAEWESDQQQTTGEKPAIMAVKRGQSSPSRAAEIDRKPEAGPMTTQSQQKVVGERTNNGTSCCSTEPVESILGDLLCEDLEDMDLGMGDRGMEYSDPRAGNRTQQITGEPISLETAKMLREVLFGSATGPSFNSEWRCQDFTFCEFPGLEYGLVQHKGGLCGVLACVQAYVLKNLLFSDASEGKKP